jgi:hypothetical protein
MEKAQPGAGRVLIVEGRYAAFRTGEPHLDPPLYWFDGDEAEILEGVQWADWDPCGRLLVATTDGRLETWSPGDWSREVIADLADLEPDPQPAPGWATEW